MNENAEKNNDNLVNAIISEINDCREDERNAQNMIFQIIGTGGSILGILTGASFFFEDSQSALGGFSILDFSRLLFVLGGLILCSCYLYLYTLGISNVLRYHYLRELEDRLSALLLESDEEHAFVSWMSFSSPITTRNPFHLKTTAAHAHYWAYLLAMASAGVFGLLITWVLYARVGIYARWETFVLAVFVALMGIFTVVFLVVCINGERMYEFARKTSLFKRKERRNKQLVKEEHKTDKRNKLSKKALLSIVRYYIYPRIEDLQKPLLIVLGFVFGLFLKNGTLSAPTLEQLWNILLVGVVVDFLGYQARYLWNDLRGLDGDAAAGKKDRLPIHLLGVDRAMLIALIVMTVKIVLALAIIAFMPQGLRGPILVIFLLIFVVAYFYELVSRKKMAYGVYFMVSFGYPLRLLAGIMAAWPEFGRADICFGDIAFPSYTMITMFIAFGLLGSFSSVLSWTHKAIDQMKRHGRVYKDYYQLLVERVGDRIKESAPLKQQGKRNDYWSVIFLASMIAMSLTPCIIALGRLEFWVTAFFELLLILCVSYFSIASVKKASIGAIGCGLVLLIKITWAHFKIGWYPLYICICVSQALFVFLFYYLRFMFDVNFSFAKACLTFLLATGKLIVGKETVAYVESHKNSESILKK